MKNITSTFITKTRLLAVLTTTCFSLAFAGAQAGDDRRSDPIDPSVHTRFLLVSFDEDFTSDTTIDGTTTIAGAFSDKGSRHEDFTTSQHGNQVLVTGTVHIIGTQGTLDLQFSGLIPANGSNPNLIEGTERITGGTGIYAGARGSGRLVATLDFETGNIVGVAELNVSTHP